MTVPALSSFQRTGSFGVIKEALVGSDLPDATRRAITLTGDGNPFLTEDC